MNTVVGNRGEPTIGTRCHLRMKQQTLVSTTRFEAGVLPRRSIADGQGLSPGDPAILAVTDFTREHPVTIDPERQIDDALDDMIRMGVRALLVVRDQRIVGLITSYDIQGERPLQFLQSSTYSLHRDIRVAHIMTPWHVLTAINWETLQTMRAGDLLQVLDHSGMTHIIVVEADRLGSSCVVRALVSRARLIRQLSGIRG
jgi:CBS domain-containing protein